MSNKNQVYPLFLWIIFYFIFASEQCYCNFPKHARAGADDIIQKSLADSVIKKYAVSASNILDSEKHFEGGERLANLGDSLWQFIDGSIDTSQSFSRNDSVRILRHLREGMRCSGGNSQIDPQLRIISPRAHRLMLEDVKFVAFELLNRTISEYIESKRLNPYNVNVQIETFIGFYSKFQRYIVKHPEKEFQRNFLERIQNVKWLPLEKHDAYILQGKLHFDLQQWQAAYMNFEKAFQMVNKPLHPIGVDPLYAEKKDSIASKTFIAKERKLMGEVRLEQAGELISLSDSLWYFYELATDSLQMMNISFYDSLAARKSMDKAMDQISARSREVRKQLKKIMKRKYSLRTDDLLLVIKKAMNTAETRLLEAKRLDPFNIVIRINLAELIYKNMGDRIQNALHYQKAIDEINHLLCVKKDRFSDYYRLGRYYRDLKRWDKAYETFKKAEDILRKTILLSGQIHNPEKYFDSPDTVPVDTLFLFQLTIFQAEARRNAYMGKEALELYRKALTMAPTTEWRENIENEIDWINWDDGNIRASEVRDSAWVYYSEQKYESAKSVYLKLLGLLKTQRTRDEIDWRIARIDFHRLGNQMEGIVRMRQVYESVSQDSVTLTTNPLNKQYIDDFGTLCYVLGQQYLDGEDKLRAYIYFTQASEVPWYGRSKAYLQLASLSQYDPKETIRLCELALKERQNLKTSEMRTVATLLSDSYTKEAEFKLAKEWHRKSLDKNWIEKKKI